MQGINIFLFAIAFLTFGPGFYELISGAEGRKQFYTLDQWEACESLQICKLMTTIYDFASMTLGLIAVTAALSFSFQDKQKIIRVYLLLYVGYQYVYGSKYVQAGFQVPSYFADPSQVLSFLGITAFLLISGLYFGFVAKESKPATAKKTQ